MKPRRTLPKIKMTPFPLFRMISHIAQLAACRAWQLTVAMIYEHMSRFSRNIYIDSTDVPGIRQTKQLSVNFRIAHDVIESGSNEHTHWKVGRVAILAGHASPKSQI